MEPPLGRRLYLGQRAVHDALDARMGKRGASLWHWILLRQAAEHEGSSQRELAENMHIEPPTLVSHLDNLATEGLVERHRDEKDRRIARVYVTDKGRRRLKELHDDAQAVDAELRSFLTKSEIDVMGKALMKIYDHFTATKEERDVKRR
jgi:MarR family transcriptional regulator, organic hydroperoxide resistance regulator